MAVISSINNEVSSALIAFSTLAICRCVTSSSGCSTAAVVEAGQLGGDLEQHRASLVALYADTLQAGLAILGIEAPERL